MILVSSAENIDLRISEFKNYVCIIYLIVLSINTTRFSTTMV